MWASVGTKAFLFFHFFGGSGDSSSLLVVRLLRPNDKELRETLVFEASDDADSVLRFCLIRKEVRVCCSSDEGEVVVVPTRLLVRGPEASPKESVDIYQIEVVVSNVHVVKVVLRANVGIQEQ